MPFKCQTLLSSGHWHLCIVNTSSLHIQACHNQQASRSNKGLRRGWNQSRSYARVINDQEKSLPWPKPDPPNTIPNPYQIFNLRQGSPYSKGRFCELVKLYHPDRKGHNHDLPGVDHLPQAVRLERYRLVIAANDILSDPIKRSAYDQCGAGWNGRPERKNSGEYGFKHQGWTSSPGYEAWRKWPDDWSPHQNATWEDWERWYSYRSGKRGKQMPVFVANGAFISMVAALAAIGGVVEVVRWGNHSFNYIEQRDRIHDETSRELTRRRAEATMHSRRDEGIQKFLRTRDHGPVWEDGYRRLLAEPGMQSSDNDSRDRSLDSKNGPESR